MDFNPVVHEKLKRQRSVHAVYGDITARDVLHHAGVSHAEIIICSLPNMVLKGANNLKILRQVRELNPHAQIIVHAELLADMPALVRRRRQLRHRAAPARSRRPPARAGSRREKRARPQAQRAGNAA